MIKIAFISVNVISLAIFSIVYFTFFTSFNLLEVVLNFELGFISFCLVMLANIRSFSKLKSKENINNTKATVAFSFGGSWLRILAILLVVVVLISLLSLKLFDISSFVFGTSIGSLDMVIYLYLRGRH